MSENTLSQAADLDRAESEVRKLKLEIRCLEWQNSGWGRFTTLVTILITVATLVAAAIGWGYDRFKERELRTKELRQQIDNRYNSGVAQLLRFPTEQSQTIPAAILVFNDLSNLIATAYEESDKHKRKNEWGILIAELVASSEFDLANPRNVEFDKAALTSCQPYSETLINNPRFTRTILQKYTVALEPFHREDPNFSGVIKADGPEGTYVLTKSLEKFKVEGFTPKLRTFATMAKVYELHLELLKKSIEQNAEDTGTLRKDFENALCTFSAGTQNSSLTKAVFHIKDDELKTALGKCFQ
jgi:hypothetical protein